MKTWSRIQIAGVVIQPGVKRHGKLSANGCGICAWNWAISLHPDPARTTEFAPAHLSTKISRFSHLHKGMDQPQKPYPGKLAASRVATLSLQPDGTLAARPGSPCASTSGAEKPMAAYVWSMRPAFAVVALVLARQCQWQGSVTAKPRQVSVLLHPFRGGCSQRNKSSHCIRLRSPLLGKARFSSPKGTLWLLFFTRASVSALVCSFRFLSLSFSETFSSSSHNRFCFHTLCSVFEFPTSLRNSWAIRILTNLSHAIRNLFIRGRK